MPVRQYNGAGPGWDEDVKPRVKPEPVDEVIDLCDSSDAEQSPQSGPSRPTKASSKRAAPKKRFKREDDSCTSSSQDDSSDDFESSLRSRAAKKRATSSGPSANPKLYAIARIVTLATDRLDASSTSAEATEKLANVNSGILSRIQKLLALARHPGTGEAEAQQALRLATRLMSSQNLTQADLLASSTAESNQTHAGMSIVEIIAQTKSPPRNESWANQVAVAVNLFFDVKAYSTLYDNRTRLSWTFYGLTVNTVAAAGAFEMVHNQVLTWAWQRAKAGKLKGKTAKNSYCQGVAAGLIALAKAEKKEEMRLAIEGENKRLREADKQEKQQERKERERLKDPPPVKPEPTEPSMSGGRNVKLEDVEDEADVKPFRNGVKRSPSEELNDGGYSRWTSNGGFGSAKLEDGADHSDDDDAHDQFYDMNADLDLDQGADDVKPHFDETLERNIIDLTDDPNLPDIKPRLKPDPENEDVKPDLRAGAGWQSSGQLIRFRQDAQKIADDYLASQHSGLKLKKRGKTTYKKDRSAFEQGREDANKIDVRRKRIQN